MQNTTVTHAIAYKHPIIKIQSEKFNQVVVHLIVYYNYVCSYMCICICSVHRYVAALICTNLTCTAPSALVVNITKTSKDSTVHLKWDVVDDSLFTTYIVTWSRAGGSLQVATLTEQISYTITGLTLDTVYTISVTGANMCGQGPEFRTSVELSTAADSSKLKHVSSLYTTHCIKCCYMLFWQLHALVIACEHEPPISRLRPIIIGMSNLNAT